MPKKHYYYHSTKLTKNAKKAFAKKATKGQLTRNSKQNSFKRCSELDSTEFTQITLSNFNEECKDSDISTQDLIYQLLKIIETDGWKLVVEKNKVQQIRDLVWSVNLIHQRCLMTGYCTTKHLLYIKCTCIDSAECPVAIYFDTEKNTLHYNKQNHKLLKDEIETLKQSFKKAQLEGTYRASVNDFTDIIDIINNAEIKPQK